MGFNIYELRFGPNIKKKSIEERSTPHYSHAKNYFMLRRQN